MHRILIGDQNMSVLTTGINSIVKHRMAVLSGEILFTNTLFLLGTSVAVSTCGTVSGVSVFF